MAPLPEVGEAPGSPGLRRFAGRAKQGAQGAAAAQEARQRAEAEEDARFAAQHKALLGEVLQLRQQLLGTFRLAFETVGKLYAQQNRDREELDREMLGGPMSSVERIGDLRQAMEERENEMGDIDLNNLMTLYPLHQVLAIVQARERAAMDQCGVRSELDPLFDDAVKSVWGPEEERLVVETWDPDKHSLTQDNHKLQHTLPDWILHGQLQKVMSERRDQVLQGIQQRQIARPPDPLDIEEADDAEWRTSKAFRYLWMVHGEEALDTEAFDSVLMAPKSAVSFLIRIFFDTRLLSPGIIETDIEASVDLEQLPSFLQTKVEEKKLFRVTDREVDRWRFVPDVARDDMVWRTQTGDMIINAISNDTSLFQGSVQLKQVSDKTYANASTGNLWVRSAKAAFRVTRGMWFDAFVDVCTGTGMPIGRTSSWILWNLVTSEELMRPENIDLIMCKEARLVAEAKAVTFRGLELQSHVPVTLAGLAGLAGLAPTPDTAAGTVGRNSSANSPGGSGGAKGAKWSLVITSSRMADLRARGRPHPRPEMLEEEDLAADEEAVAVGAGAVSDRQGPADEGLAVGRGASVRGEEAASAASPKAPGRGRHRRRGNAPAGQERRPAAEREAKIDAVTVRRLGGKHLVFLDQTQDVLSIKLMIGDKVEGIGTLDWKGSREEAILSVDQSIELLRPVTREKVGSIVLGLRLDDCYKEIFAALDSDETQQMAAQRKEQRKRQADVEKQKANAFMAEAQVKDHAPLHSMKSGGSREDELELERLAVNDWDWGFVPPPMVRNNLLKVLHHTPFVSKSMFGDFLRAVQIQLPEQVVDTLWDEKLEKHFPLKLRWGEKIIRVWGLVALADCWRCLCRHILLGGARREVDEELRRTKPALAALAAGGIPIGGIWFTPFYNVVMSTCQVVVPEDVLQEIYRAQLDPQTGLMPLDMVYDAIEKIGRPGLPYATFKNFVTALGIKVEEQQIALTFQQVDVNQNNCLDQAELRASTAMLLMQTVPLLLLERQKLTIQHIVPHIVVALLVLASLFAFLLLAFQSFSRGGPRGGGVFHTLVQSSLAFGASVGVKAESTDVDVQKLKEIVAMRLEQIFGVPMTVAGNAVEAKGDS